MDFRNNSFLKRLSCFFIIISLLALTACKNKTYIQNQASNVEVDFKKGDVIEKYNDINEQSFSIAEEKNILSQMDEKLDNDYVKLYLGKTYFDIAVLDKKTGAVWFSNPLAYKEDTLNKLSTDGKKEALSQISISYFDGIGNEFVYNSYGDAYNQKDLNQISVSKKNNVLSLKYTLGKKEDEMVLYRILSQSKHEELKKLLDDKVSQKLVSRSEAGLFNNSYLEIDYDKADNTQKAKYKQLYPKIETQKKLYVLQSNLTLTEKTRLEKVYIKLEQNIELVLKENELAGGFKSYGVSPYFTIPINYSLSGSDLICDIDIKAIEVAKNYILNKVNVLKQLGSAPLGSKGYIFMPDQSGTIIENDRKSPMQALDISFYGNDVGINYPLIEKTKAGSLIPVFGIKNEDKAMFAIVEKGDSVSGAFANVSNSILPNNRAWAYFTYMATDKMSLSDIGNSAIILTKSPCIGADSFRVRYHFLYSQKANYSGMAGYYRDYLENLGYITQKVKKESYPLSINIIGGFKIQKTKFGLPYQAFEALSTFKQAEELSKTIKEKTNAELFVKLTANSNGGIANTPFINLKPEKNLGDFKGIKSYFEKTKDIESYFEINLSTYSVMKKDKSINDKTDLSYFLNRRPAHISSYFPNSNKKNLEDSKFFLHPTFYKTIWQNIKKDLNANNIKKLYIEDIATYLGGVYYGDNVISREQCKIETEALLRHINKDGFELILNKPNVYSWKYANAITGLPTEDTGLRISSYSVPFLQMLLHGKISYTDKPVNLSDDYNLSLLKLIETGSGIEYKLMKQRNTVLKNTPYESMYSLNSNVWLEQIEKQSNNLSSILKGISKLEIIEHKMILQNVFSTRYENNKEIIVNYNSFDVLVDGKVIKSNDYLIRGGI